MLGDTTEEIQENNEDGYYAAFITLSQTTLTKASQEDKEELDNGIKYLKQFLGEDELMKSLRQKSPAESQTDEVKVADEALPKSTEEPPKVTDEAPQEEQPKVAEEEITYDPPTLEAPTRNEEQLTNDSDSRAIEEAVQDTEKIGKAMGTNNPSQKQRPNEKADKTDVEEITLEQKAKDNGFNSDGLVFDNEDDKRDFWHKVARYVSSKPTDSVRTINSFKRFIETTIAAGGHIQDGRL
jgi:hypothetical protein